MNFYKLLNQIGNILIYTSSLLNWFVYFWVHSNDTADDFHEKVNSDVFTFLIVYFRKQHGLLEFRWFFVFSNEMYAWCLEWRENAFFFFKYLTHYPSKRSLRFFVVENQVKYRDLSKRKGAVTLFEKFSYFFHNNNLTLAKSIGLCYDFHICFYSSAYSLYRQNLNLNNLTEDEVVDD